MNKTHRSAITGEYVSEEFAKANPDTTVSETVDEPSRDALRKRMEEMIQRIPIDGLNLIDRIKAHEAATLALVREVMVHVDAQSVDAQHSRVSSPIEAERLRNAEPGRWASIARTDFQTGYMALVRAVAQPVTP